MARWVKSLIEGARGNEAESGPLKPALVRELFSAQTVIPLPDPLPGLGALHPHFLSYGLGISLRDYRGYKVATHTGGLRGMVSRVFVVPDAKLGVVVLTNQESGEARYALAYRLLDAGLGAPVTDWISAFPEANKKDEARTEPALSRQSQSRAN